MKRKKLMRVLAMLLVFSVFAGSIPGILAADEENEAETVSTETKENIPEDAAGMVTESTAEPESENNAELEEEQSSGLPVITFERVFSDDMPLISLMSAGDTWSLNRPVSNYSLPLLKKTLVIKYKDPAKDPKDQYGNPLKKEMKAGTRGPDALQAIKGREKMWTYCLAPGMNNHLGMNEQTEETLPEGMSSVTWWGLSSEQRDAIKNIIYCGFPNESTSDYVQAYAATQLLIWEVITGHRDPVSYEWLSGSSPAEFISYYDLSDAHTSQMGSYYSGVLARCKKVKSTVPSFMGKDPDDAPTLQLEADPAYPGNGSEYKYRVFVNGSSMLTDTNDVLRYYKEFNADGDYIPMDGLKLHASGENLWIAATESAAAKIEGYQDGYTIKINPRISIGIIFQDTDGSGNVVSGQPTIGVKGIDLTPPPAYLNIKVPPTEKTFTLQKKADATSACIEQLEGNKMYSLAGGEFEVYKDGRYQETLITDKNGQAVSSKKYKAGTELVIIETVPPKGYRLNTATETIEIGEDGNLVEFSDVPLLDPPFTYRKIDAYTTEPQGDCTFEGAVFRWDYYDNTDWSGSPARTWYLHTDEDGYVFYKDAYLASGYKSDPFYLEPSGLLYRLPRGTLKVTEISAPSGYSAFEEPLYFHFYGDDAQYMLTEESAAYVKRMGDTWALEEPVGKLGGVDLKKYDDQLSIDNGAQGGASLEGAVFDIINYSKNPVYVNGKVKAPGEVCCSIVTDADGNASTGSILPMGTYRVKESEASPGYLKNEDWHKDFSITEDGETYDFTYESACPETVISGGLIIEKIDPEQNSLLSTLKFEGITFDIVNDNTQCVVVNGSLFAPGETVMTIPVEWDEENDRWIAQTEKDDLPYGNYLVKENPVEPGSDLANNFYFLNKEPVSITITEHLTYLESSVENEARKGKISVEKVDADGSPMHGVRIMLESSINNGEAWQSVAEMSTDEDGKLTFDDLDLRYRYRLTEKHTENGKTLLSSVIWEGEIPAELDKEPVVPIRIVNTQTFLLPAMGSRSAMFIPMFGTALISLGCLLFFKRKKKQTI